MDKVAELEQRVTELEKVVAEIRNQLPKTETYAPGASTPNEPTAK